MDKEALKFEVFTSVACFKTPFSIRGVETYPLPPYSTVIGFLYKALGRKYKGQKFSLSVQGDYKAIFRDYLTFRKYNLDKKRLEKKPIEVPFLYSFKLVAHLLGSKEILNLFERALRRPASYLGLGLREIPAKIGKVKRVKIKWTSLEDPVELKYNAYIPIELAKNLDFFSNERGDKYFTGFEGIEYILPSFIKKISWYRDFEYEQVVYIPKGVEIEEDSEVLIDEEGDFVFPTGG